MTDEDLLKLSAYADGELPASERVEIESRLNRDPAFARTLATMKSLDSAAQNEPEPQRDFDSAIARLEKCAATESIPVVSTERFAAMWNNITLSSRAHNEATPKIDSKRWNGVWTGISTRTAQINDIQPAEKPERKIVKVRTLSQVGIGSRAWIWAVGAGVAAAIALALWLPDSASHITTPPETESPVASGGSMSIPETQDENYGVRIRFVSGNSDPVVSLYYKSPGGKSAQGLLNGDLEDDQ